MAQIIGAIVGAFIVYFFYIDHFNATQEEGLKRACFCTDPAIRHYSSNFLSEFIGTAVLVFVIFYISGADIILPGTSSSTPIGLGSINALPVSILVWAIGLSLGGTTGYAINPARDLGPRIALAFLQRKLNTSPDWRYAWVPILGPLSGSIFAALAYKLIM